MAHPKTYSDEWMKDHCGYQGTENAVEKLDFDKIDNPATKAVFEAAGLAWIEPDKRLCEINKHLGIQ